jgi:hypothetical protein
MLLPGKEGSARWEQVLAAIPSGVFRRIQALVVDNVSGIHYVAAQRGWLLQLCHFHVLKKLQAFRGGIRYSLHGGPVRKQITQLVRQALELPEGTRLSGVLSKLRRISNGDCGTRRVRAALREFLKRIPFYRSYLSHPELGLPRTTNSVESMCRLIREMLRSSRAGSNPESLLLWSTAFIRMNPSVTCNGRSINRIN